MTEYFREAALPLGLLLGLPKISVAVVATAIVVCFAYWKKTKIIVAGKYLYINKGVIIRRSARVRISSISAVATTRSLIDVIAGSTSVTFFTEAGAVCGRRGIKIPADCESGVCALLGFVKGAEVTKSTFLQTLLHAVSTTSVVTGTLFVVPAIRKIDELLEENESTVDKIGELGKNLFGLSPPVNLVAAFLLITFGISLLLFIIRYAMHKSNCSDDTVSVSFGVLPKRTVYMRKSEISSICEVQTPIMIFLNKSIIKADVSGIKREKRRDIYLSPPTARQKQQELLGDLYKAPKNNEEGETKTFRAKQWRYYATPFYFISSITAALLTVSIMFPWAIELVILIATVLFVALSYLFFLAKYAYRHTQINLCTGEAHFTARGNIIRAKFNTKRAGVIALTTFPYDRKTRVCRVKVVLRTELGEKINVKYISRNVIDVQLKKALEELNNRDII